MNKKGITIVEIIIVISIIGIISIVSLPYIGNLIDMRSGIAVDKVMGDLVYAKRFAMNYNCQTRVAYTPGTEQYTVSENSSGSFLTATDPTTRAAFIVTLGAGAYSGADIATADFGGQTTIEFDSNGKPYGFDGGSSTALIADGTVTFTNTNLTITVEPETGRIYAT